jgi:hypothetical protein
MKHTLYRDVHTMLIPNRAMAYDPKDAGAGYTLNISYFEQTGDGAVNTSVEDLLQWDENFYSGRIGGKDFLNEIQEPGKLNNGKTLDYAKGLFVGKYRGLRFVDHGGSWGGYRAQLLRFPEQHFSVVCLCNLANANPEKRAHQVADLFLAGEMKEPRPATEPDFEKREKKPTAALEAGKLQAYSGQFRSAELLATYSFAVQDGKLMLQNIQGGDGYLSSSQHLILRPVGPDTFAVDEEGLEFAFQRDGSGNVLGFTLDAGRTKGLNFQQK